MGKNPNNFKDYFKMKITGIEFYLHEMNLKNPYTIAYETIDYTTNVFLKIETDSSITGYGCAAPDLEVTGETGESVQKCFSDVVRPDLKGHDPLRYSYIMENLKNELKDHPSARAAVDMALYDILGKQANLPLWKMLGGYRDRIKTSITIGILPLKETIESAQKCVSQGFSCLKIKGGIDLDSDIERLLQLRQVLGKHIDLRFDANQGYTVEQSIYVAEKIESVKLELFEQPTTKDRPDLLGQVRKKINIPVMADESVTNVQDASNLVQNRLVDMLNIKLMKVGGIIESIHINSIAQSGSLGVMIGCMDESALAIAAGLHFALANPNVLYADLDGHLDLINDPVKDKLKIKDGWLFAPTKPGIGIEIDLF